MANPTIYLLSQSGAIFTYNIESKIATHIISTDLKNTDFRDIAVLTNGAGFAVLENEDIFMFNQIGTLLESKIHTEITFGLSSFPVDSGDNKSFLLVKNVVDKQVIYQVNFELNKKDNPFDFNEISLSDCKIEPSLFIDPTAVALVEYDSSSDLCRYFVAVHDVEEVVLNSTIRIFEIRIGNCSTDPIVETLLPLRDFSKTETTTSLNGLVGWGTNLIGFGENRKVTTITADSIVEIDELPFVPVGAAISPDFISANPLTLDF